MTAHPQPTPAVAGSPRPGDPVRRQILDDAEALLAEAGEAAFSIRKLVARCGHPAPTIYRHFGGKRQLIGELLDARFAELADELRRDLAMDDPVEQMRVFACAFARFALANPIHYRLLTLTGSEADEAPPSGEECRSLLSAPLDRLSAQGRVPVAQLEVLRQAFWALVHGVISLQVMRPDHAWDARLLEVALEGLIAGTVAPTANRGAAVAGVVRADPKPCRKQERKQTMEARR